MYPDPIGWPAAEEDAPRRVFPPPAWPSKEQLSYAREAITVLLMLLALPWLTWKLLTKPAAVLSARGHAIATKGP